MAQNNLTKYGNLGATGSQTLIKETGQQSWWMSVGVHSIYYLAALRTYTLSMLHMHMVSKTSLQSNAWTKQGNSIRWMHFLS